VSALVVVIAAVALVTCIAPIGPRRLSVVQFASLYVTRFRSGFAGVRLLPEHVVALIMLVSAALTGRLGEVTRAARSKTLVLTGAYIAWGACVSLAASPDPGASLGIAAWLALSWLIAVNLVAFGGTSARMQRQLVGWAGLAAWTAILVYVGDRLFGVGIGMQLEPNTGSRALFGVAWEANILASTLSAALFLAVTAGRSTISRRMLVLSVPAMLAAILLALTRAAVLGLVLGLVCWAVMSGGAALRRCIAWIVLGAIAAAAIAVVSPATLRPVEEKLSLLVDTGSQTGHNRLEDWSAAVGDIDAKSVVVGLGLNTFGQRHLDRTRPDNPTPGYLGSLPLQIVYDTGVVGVFLLGAALVSVWPQTRTARRRALGLIIVVLVSTTATSTFWFGSTWALVALATISRARVREPVRPFATVS
jgi:hypothetical protein